MPDANRRPVFRHVQMLRDRIVEREFFLFNQHHDRHRGELLSDRAGLKHCLRRDPCSVLKVRDTVSPAKCDFAIVSDHHRAAGNLVFLQVFVYEIADPIRRGVGISRAKDCQSQ